jgi:WD40 repeat protein
MSRIFISHSSADNAFALALGIWLKRVGWDDYFLDFESSKGIEPGANWQHALQAANDRCEAVLILLSKAWLESRWCLAEFHAAQQQGKPIFGLLIADIPYRAIPKELTDEWQLCNIVRGDEREIIIAESDPQVPKTQVSFAQAGLQRLKFGLERTGLAPSYFPWPPLEEPGRAAYPGLRSLEAQDAAVFFGRNADIVHGLDMLRRVREQRVQRMVAILGASGAGKSSFLKAGLWPRLKRDDRHFLLLPIVRPQSAVISGATGLVEALKKAYEEYGAPRPHDDISVGVETDDGFTRMIDDLVQRHMQRLVIGRTRPTVVLCIDQAEEMFRGEGQREAARFTALLTHILRQPNSLEARSESVGHYLAVLCTTTQDYEKVQTAQGIKDIRQAVFSLAQMDRAEFKSVIDGPAACSTKAGRKLAVSPELTARLLSEARGADALPLLAFTLERLYLVYGASEELSVEQYEQLGGVQGSIDAAVEAALASPGTQPVIPSDAAACERLLHDGFIPWLAGIDPDTEEPRRRVARWEEIPEASRGVIDRLVSQRLLVRDRRKIEGSTTAVTVVEVAHEALLRQWGALTRWLDADAAALKSAEAVQRSAKEWCKRKRAGDHPDDFLAHSGERLISAEALKLRPDFVQLLGASGIAYLDACRDAADAAIEERENRVKQVEEAQKKRGHAQRWTATVLLALTAFLIYFGMRTVQQTRQNAMETSTQLAKAAASASDRGYYDRAMRLSLMGRDKGFLSPGTRDADEQLRRAAAASLLSAQLNGHQDDVTSVSFSDDGTRLLTLSLDRTVRVWDSATGQQISLMMHGTRIHRHSPDDIRVKSSRESFMDNSGITSAVFDHTARRVLTAGYDGTVRMWDASTGKETARRSLGMFLRVDHAALDPDGVTAVIIAGSSNGEIWNVPANTIVPFKLEDGPMTYAAFDHDGSRFLATYNSTTRGSAGGVWNTRTGKRISRFEPTESGFKSASFSSDGQRILGRPSTGMTATLFDANTGKLIARFEGYDAALFPDGSRVITAWHDANNVHTLRMWDAATGKEIWAPVRLDSAVTSLTISPNGQRVVTTDENGVAQVWDAIVDRETVKDAYEEAYPGDRERSGAGRARVKLRNVAKLVGHARPILTSAFAPDSEHIATGTGTGVASGNGYIAAASGAVPDSESIATSPLDFTVRIWNVADGKTVARRFFGHQTGVDHVAFSPDSQRLLSTSQWGHVMIWTTRDGTRIVALPNETQAIVHGIFSADGTRAAVIGEKDSQVADARTGAAIAPLVQHFNMIQDAAFSADGRHIVIVTMNGQLVIVDASTGKSVLDCNAADALWHGEFSPDGRRVLTAGPKTAAQLSDLTRCEPVLLYDETGAAANKSDALRATFSADGARVLVSYADHSVRVWNASTAEAISRLRFADKRDPPDEARFSPDGERVLTWSEHYPGGEAIEPTKIARPQLWNAATGEQVVELMTPQLLPTIHGPAFSEDGRFVAAGSGGSILVWDTATGRNVVALDSGTNTVNSVAFSQDGDSLAAAASTDDVALTWPVDWITRPGEWNVVDAVCRHRLLGANSVTPEDAADAWPLRDKVGKKVCE